MSLRLYKVLSDLVCNVNSFCVGGDGGCTISVWRHKRDLDDVKCDF